jgi:hypothetical protein
MARSRYLLAKIVFGKGGFFAKQAFVGREISEFAAIPPTNFSCPAHWMGKIAMLFAADATIFGACPP